MPLFQIIRKLQHKHLQNWSSLMLYRGRSYPKSLDMFTCSYIQPDVDSFDRNNTLLVAGYTQDIASYYRRIEPLCVAPSDYMVHQTDISERMRSILVDWLIEVHLKFKLMPETLYLTISCIDRFLAKKKVARRHLQLVGVAAMLISSKYEEIWAPELRDFVYICDKAYTRVEILRMEKDILNTLTFQLTVPTHYLFLQRFLKISTPDKNVAMLSQYLLELTLVDYSMVKFSSSQIAASAVYLANKYTLKADFWNYMMERHTLYSAESLETCTTTLNSLYKKATTTQFTAVYKKFSGPKFNGIAKIHLKRHPQ